MENGEGPSPEKTPQKLEIDAAVTNLLDKSMFYTAFSPTGLVDTVKESGYRGFEWHPLRTPSGLLVSSGRVGKDVKDAIVSLHQSYRGEKSWVQVLKHPNRTLAVVSYIVLPERVASLNDLEHLQKVVGKKLPVVLYPSWPGEKSGIDRDFGEKLFQPYTDMMLNWGAKTVDELISEARKRGYTGFALDLFHMRRPSQEDETKGVNLLTPWQKALPQLLPFTKEIHVSAGRADLFYIKGLPDTKGELKSLLNGKGDTELLQMLRMVRRQGWKGRVVTEIPAAALHRLRVERGQSPSAKNLIQDHRKIVGNIQDILA